MQLRYPTMLAAKAGNLVNGNVRTDAIGRRVLRNDQLADNHGDYVPTHDGGMPQPRGPETYIPHLLQAAKRGGLDPTQATSPAVLKGIKGLPQSPGGLFNLSPQDYRAHLPETGGRRPADPILQALAGLRKQLGGTSVQVRFS